MIRIERRLEQPRWLSVVVPVVSVAVAFLLATLVLVVTHHPPMHTFRRLFEAAFLDNGALTDTLVSDRGRFRIIEKVQAAVRRTVVRLNPRRGPTAPSES